MEVEVASAVRAAGAALDHRANPGDLRSSAVASRLTGAWPGGFCPVGHLVAVAKQHFHDGRGDVALGQAPGLDSVQQLATPFCPAGKKRDGGGSRSSGQVGQPPGHRLAKRRIVDPLENQQCGGHNPGIRFRLNKAKQRGFQSTEVDVTGSPD